MFFHSLSAEEEKNRFVKKLACTFYKASRPADLSFNALEHFQSILNRHTDLVNNGLEGADELLDKSGLQRLKAKWSKLSTEELNVISIVDEALHIARNKLAPAP